MATTNQNPEVLSLMARMMIPFRRALGYSFDTAAFLEDAAYAQIIIQLASESTDPALQKLGQQLAEIVPPSAAQSAPRQDLPQSGQATAAQTQQANPEADALRAELLRKYQGSIR